MSGRRFRTSETVDFAIIGSGAAGGVIARELSQAGFSVVVFEQGPRLTPAKFEHDELKYWYMSGITNDPEKSPQTFRDSPSKKAQRVLLRPSLIYARTVGGTSIHYTANYWRFTQADFDDFSHVLMDLTNYSQRQLNNIADELNGRPRQTLEWRTPSEAFTALVR